MRVRSGRLLVLAVATALAAGGCSTSSADSLADYRPRKLAPWSSE
jgi:hypothetical protein